MIYAPPTERRERPRGQGWKVEHTEPRVGVCIHFDGSRSDAGSVRWLTDPRAWNVGYHALVSDTGVVTWLAPYTARVYHAGVCRPSQTLVEKGARYRDANSALLGFSVSATDGDVATPLQLLALAWLCREAFTREGWSTDDLWRITGHEDEAWPRGRKHDPTGLDPSRPVVDMRSVRHLVPALTSP